MRDLIFYGNAIIGLWEDMLEVNKPLKRYYRKDYGFLLSSKTLRSMLDLVMFVKEWVNLHEQMNFHYTLFKR